MSEAQVLYSDVKFIKKKENTTDIVSSSTNTTYSEVGILKTQPPAELPGPQQHAVSNGESKVKNVALVILGVLLLVVVVAFSYVFFDNMQTKKSLQTLKAEHEATKKNFSEILSEKRITPTSCLQPPTMKTDASCLKCDKDWEQDGERCYFFSCDIKSWEESRNICQSKGGDLVKIDSNEEQTFLDGKLRDKMDDPEDKFWIGLTDSKEESKWLWVDGSPLNTSLSFWNNEEPDNWEVEDADGEDCVRMGEKGGDTNSWFDKSCKKPHKRICEKEAEIGIYSTTCS